MKTTAPPDPNTKKPKFRPPPLACDAHCHIFGPGAKFPYAPDTVKYCAWWLDNDGTWTCDLLEQTYGLSMADFQRWV